jgi:omega-amidase
MMVFLQVLATTEHEPAIVYAELDLEQIKERRTNLPLTSQKRRDLYDLLDKEPK